MALNLKRIMDEIGAYGFDDEADKNNECNDTDDDDDDE
jgi:hypothetical protein